MATQGKTKQFGIWVPIANDNEHHSTKQLKDYANRHGCDPASIHKYTRLERHDMKIVAYKAHFKEKDNEPTS